MRSQVVHNENLVPIRHQSQKEHLQKSKHQRKPWEAGGFSLGCPISGSFLLPMVGMLVDYDANGLVGEEDQRHVMWTCPMLRPISCSKAKWQERISLLDRPPAVVQLFLSNCWWRIPVPESPTVVSNRSSLE